MENERGDTLDDAAPLNEYARGLMVTDPLREGVIRSAIESLGLPAGSRGLDAGCGIGTQAFLLAEAVGAAGHVSGVDLSPQFLDIARTRAEQRGLAERVSFRKGDVRKLPFEHDSFDWVWSADCVGYAPMEPVPLIRELARVVKPGGTVAILAWSSEVLLPGYPWLEAQLDATTAGLAPFRRGSRPEQHFLRGLGWFREAGLKKVEARTFAGGAHAPLSDALREALVALFGMRWPAVEGELTGNDLVAYRELCLPESPRLILDHPDYYCFFTYSMFHGRVRDRAPDLLVVASEGDRKREA